MGSAVTAGAVPERAQITVAELLSRRAASTPAPPDSLPEGWSTAASSPRRCLALAAAGVLAAGSIVGAATLSSELRGPTLGSETAEGGHPSKHQTKPAKASPAPRRMSSIAGAVGYRRSQPRVGQAVPLSRVPAATERPRRPHRSANVVYGGDDVYGGPAGSALSSLTPRIGEVTGRLLGSRR